MKAPLKSILATLSIAVLLAAVVAAGPSEAGAAVSLTSLSKQITWLKGQVNTLKTQIASVRSANGVQDANIASVSDRVSAVERANGGFFPIRDLTVTPSIEAVSETYQGSTSNNFSVPLGVAWVDERTGLRTESGAPARYYFLLTVNGVTYPNGVGLAASPQTLPSGTPLTVEYWVEHLDRRAHSSSTITDWSWRVYRY